MKKSMMCPIRKERLPIGRCRKGPNFFGNIGKVHSTLTVISTVVPYSADWNTYAESVYLYRKEWESAQHMLDKRSWLYRNRLTKQKRKKW